MNPKVLALVGWVRRGYAIAGVHDGRQGGVRIVLRRGGDSRAMWFDHFEVPAILQECTSVGVAK